VARPIPPKANLATLAQASLFSVRDMLAYARSLSAPRAHALAVLALEEVGKANLCMIPLSLPENLSGDDFWKAFTDHESKLMWARGLLEMMVREPASPVLETYERLIAACKSDHVRKLRGLYVDYADGKVVTPSDVTAAEAETMIGDVHELLDFHMRAWGDDDAPARILQRLSEHADDLEQTYAQLMPALADEPEAAVSQVRRAVHARMRGELE
jgi:AbiV family abortive infection protein